MKKRIEIQVDQIDWTSNRVKFHVAEQSHRTDKFGNNNRRNINGDTFIAFDTSIPTITSSGCLEYRKSDNVLFVRGTLDYRDNDIIGVPFEDFGLILKAIAAYNACDFIEKHKIVIDGKEIEISDESFKTLKESLK